MRVRPIVVGRWSGGGQVTVANVLEAMRRRPDVFAPDGDLPLLPRNHASPRLMLSGRFLLMPQNAWPWSPRARSLTEFSRQARLRVASDTSMARSVGVVRISGAIPDRGRTAPSILHNVLDADFDALLQSPGARPHLPYRYFLCAGSIVEYRNIDQVLAAHRLYRQDGGATSLVIAGGGTAKAERALRQRVSDLSAVTYLGPQSRRTVVRLLQSCWASILPSAVEASPIGLLEALASAPRVAVSRITAHAEMVKSNAAIVNWFDPASVRSIADALILLDDSPEVAVPSGLAAASARRILRERWADDFAHLIQQLACPP